jgi:ribosomal protein S18 acetylase RimI-like enzyme
MDNINTVTVRDAAEADYPAALAVMRRAFAEYAERLDPPSGVHHETLASMVERAGEGGLLVAETGGQIVGMVLYRPEPEHLYLGRLAVLPEHRGRGIGHTLIAAVERRARELGFARIHLAVRLQLPEMRASYERLGYQVVAAHAHPGYSQPTFVSMEKDLHLESNP